MRVFVKVFVVLLQYVLSEMLESVLTCKEMCAVLVFCFSSSGERLVSLGECF